MGCRYAVAGGLLWQGGEGAEGWLQAVKEGGEREKL